MINTSKENYISCYINATYIDVSNLLKHYSYQNVIFTKSLINEKYMNSIMDVKPFKLKRILIFMVSYQQQVLQLVLIYKVLINLITHFEVLLFNKSVLSPNIFPIFGFCSCDLII